MNPYIFLLLSLPILTNCQSNFDGTTGMIYSPNYPDNYDNNMNAVYTITVPVGHYIHLTFLDYITEDPYDFLEISLGVGDSITSFKNLTGDQTGLSLDLLDSQATLVFISDLTTVFRGFAIKFDSVVIGSNYTPPSSCSSPLHCANFGIVTTPNFPDNYPNNISCSYLLVAPKSHVINLQFVAFNTEDGYDVVYVYDGSNNSFPLIGQYSGNKLPLKITSSSNSLYLYFKSDLVNNFLGFSALYTTFDLPNNARRGVLPQIIPSNNRPVNPNVNLIKWLSTRNVGN